MDPVTHAALGAASAVALLGKFNKQIAWQAGALAAMAPDLDIFIQFSQEPLSLERWHRYITHSLFFIPIGGLIVALFLMCFPHFKKHWKLTIGASLAGYATHGLLDGLTSYGTVLFWPWSESRISWDIIAIIDPFFTIPLVLGTAWSVIHREQKGVMIGLLCAGCFLVFNTFQHQRAIDTIQEYATKNGIDLTRIRAMPELISSTYWRVIAKNKGCFNFSEVRTPLLKESTVIPVAEFLGFNEAELPYALTEKQKQELIVFSWFTDNYMIVANKNPFILADGRYTLGLHPMYSLWGIELLPSQKHINKLSLIKINQYCTYP